MQLTDAQIEKFENEGLLVIDDYFTQKEIDLIEKESIKHLKEPGIGRVTEEGSELARAVNGSHLRSALFSGIVRAPRLLSPAMQLLNSPVYIHQFKINAKFAFIGEQWEWHQDFTYWKMEDKMPAPRALTMAITLDDIYEINGPMMFIPYSHHSGASEVETRYKKEKDWTQNFGADLKYKFDHKLIAELARKHGVVVPKLKRGSIIFFHSNVFHGSSANMSPLDRTMIFISYNSVDNVLPQSPQPRPDFIAGRDFRPLVPGIDKILNIPLGESMKEPLTA